MPFALLNGRPDGPSSRSLSNRQLCKLSLDICKVLPYTQAMIRSFRNRALADLWRAGRSARIDGRLHARILARLEALNEAERPEDMNVPGFDFHALRGFKPTRYTVHVNGPWCVTFEFDEGDALKVDFEQYH